MKHNAHCASHIGQQSATLVVGYVGARVGRMRAFDVNVMARRVLTARVPGRTRR